MISNHRDASDSKLLLDLPVWHASKNHAVDLFSVLVPTELTCHLGHRPRSVSARFVGY